MWASRVWMQRDHHPFLYKFLRGFGFVYPTVTWFIEFTIFPKFIRVTLHTSAHHTYATILPFFVFTLRACIYALVGVVPRYSTHLD